MEDYWSHEDLYIYHGDSREVIPELDIEFTCTITSPPYGVGLEYERGVNLEGLVSLMEDIAEVIYKFTKPSGYFHMIYGDIVKNLKGTGEIPMGYYYYPMFTDVGWRLSTRRIWDKDWHSCSAPWTIGNNRAFADWEHLWTFQKEPFEEKARDRSWSTKGVVCIDEFSKCVTEHPAEFPITIPLFFLHIYADEGDWILDPCGGSGSTLVACHYKGYKGVIIDKEEMYCEMAAQRMDEIISQGTLFEQSEIPGLFN